LNADQQRSIVELLAELLERACRGELSGLAVAATDERKTETYWGGQFGWSELTGMLRGLETLRTQVGGALAEHMLAHHAKEPHEEPELPAKVPRARPDAELAAMGRIVRELERLEDEAARHRVVGWVLARLHIVPSIVRELAPAASWPTLRGLAAPHLEPADPEDAS